MLTKRLLFVSALTVLLASSAWAGHNTVKSTVTLRIEPQAGIVSEIGTEFSSFGSSGYTEELWIDLTLDYHSDVSVSDLRNFIDFRDRWVLYCAHGAVDAQSCQYFPPDMIGEAIRDAILEEYIRLGYPGVYGSSISTVDGLGIEAYTIGFTGDFIRSEIDATGSVIHLAGCDGASLSNDYLNCRAFLAYAFHPSIGQALAHNTDLYQRLRGWKGGPTNRSLRTAVGSLISPRPTLFESTGQYSTVVAPAVESTSLPQTSTYSAPTSAAIQFQGELDQTVPLTSIITVEGPCFISNLRWNGADRIEFDLTGRWKGEGGVIVNAPYTKSSNNAVELDGNSSPSGSGYGGWNARTPNGDDFIWYLKSNIGGDNPAASIVGFTAIADASETKLRWLVESEVNTATYLVETAPDANGPWTTQISLPARNAPSYTVQWNGPDAWYRLREIETDGDTLTQAYASRQVLEPFVPDFVDTIAATQMQKELQQRYPAMMLVQQAASTVTDVIYAPTSFQDAAQTLAYLKTSWGIPTSVITLPTIGGATGIKSSIASLVQQGARNFLLLGDANATSDVQGHIREGNPATLDSGYVAPGGTTPQPQLNLIPVGSYPMVWGTQELGMTYWTKYFASDWWYIDLDGDGLPDPGLTIGRLPAGTLAEAYNGVYKQSNAHGINPLNLGVNHVYVHTYAFDVQGNSGADAIAYTDSLLTYLPSDRIVDRFTDKPTAWYSEARRDSICIAQFNKGSALQIFKSTVNNRYHDAGCLDQSRRAPLSGIAYNPSRLAFQYISSCGGGDFDRSEVDSVGRPLGERLLENRSDLGTWGYFAPSRGTWQHGNHLMDKEFLTYLYRTGASSVGQAAALSVYRLATTHPEFRDLALSYVFIGDPSVPLAGMKRTTLDAAPWTVGQRLSLAVPQPNPVRGTTVLRLVMPIASQANLSLYDAQGRRVQTIVQGRLEAGQHEYRLLTAMWSPGVYFVQLRVNEEQRVQKMVVMR